MSEQYINSAALGLTQGAIAGSLGPLPSDAAGYAKQQAYQEQLCAQAAADRDESIRIQLRLKCMETAMGLGHRDVEMVVKSAQILYDYILGTPKPSLSVVP